MIKQFLDLGIAVLARVGVLQILFDFAGYGPGLELEAGIWGSIFGAMVLGD